MCRDHPELFVGLFFFNDTATTEIYTLSLHDALPIYRCVQESDGRPDRRRFGGRRQCSNQDRKSTRLNSSHHSSSYAVFCLKKKVAAHAREPLHISLCHALPQHVPRGLF